MPAMRKRPAVKRKRPAAKKKTAAKRPVKKPKKKTAAKRPVKRTVKRPVKRTVKPKKKPVARKQKCPGGVCPLKKKKTYYGPGAVKATSWIKKTKSGSYRPSARALYNANPNSVGRLVSYSDGTMKRLQLRANGSPWLAPV